MDLVDLVDFVDFVDCCVEVGRGGGDHQGEWPVTESKSSFSTSRRGYMQSEVDHYVQTYVLPLRAELDAASTQVGRLEHELADARTREEAMQITIFAATKTEGEFVAEAEKHFQTSVETAAREAERLIGDARRKASTLMQSANADAERVVSEAETHAEQLAATATAEAEGLARVAQDIDSEAHGNIEQLRHDLMTTRNQAAAAAEDAAAARNEVGAAHAQAEVAMAGAEEATDRATAAAREAEIAHSEATRLQLSAETLMVEAETARAAADAARSGAISGAAELRESAVADGEATLTSAHGEASRIIEQADADADALLAAAAAAADAERAEGAADAERLVHDARREALAIIDEIRAETEALLTQAMALEPAPSPATPSIIDRKHSWLHDDLTATVSTASADDDDADAIAEIVEKHDPSDDEEYADRRSFYERRSARLPNIGPSGVTEALAAIGAMRQQLDGSRKRSKALSPTSETEIAARTA